MARAGSLGGKWPGVVAAQLRNSRNELSEEPGAVHPQREQPAGVKGKSRCLAEFRSPGPLLTSSQQRASSTRRSPPSAHHGLGDRTTRAFHCETRIICDHVRSRIARLGSPLSVGPVRAGSAGRRDQGATAAPSRGSVKESWAAPRAGVGLRRWNSMGSGVPRRAWGRPHAHGSSLEWILKHGPYPCGSGLPRTRQLRCDGGGNTLAA